MITKNYILTDAEVKEVVKLGFSQKWEYVLYTEISDWFQAFMNLYTGIEYDFVSHYNGKVTVLENVYSETADGTKIKTAVNHHRFENRKEVHEFIITTFKNYYSPFSNLVKSNKF